MLESGVSPWLGGWNTDGGVNVGVDVGVDGGADVGVYGGVDFMAGNG